MPTCLCISCFVCSKCAIKCTCITSPCGEVRTSHFLKRHREAKIQNPFSLNKVLNCSMCQWNKIVMCPWSACSRREVSSPPFHSPLKLCQEIEHVHTGPTLFEGWGHVHCLFHVNSWEHCRSLPMEMFKLFLNWWCA